MHKPEPVLENKVHKIFWNFKILADHLIPIRRPDLVLINKKKTICNREDFTIPVDNRVKIK